MKCDLRSCRADMTPAFDPDTRITTWACTAEGCGRVQDRWDQGVPPLEQYGVVRPAVAPVRDFGRERNVLLGILAGALARRDDLAASRFDPETEAWLDSITTDVSAGPESLAAPEGMRLCAWEPCSAPFVPKVPMQLYDHTRCSTAAAQARRERAKQGAGVMS